MKQILFLKEMVFVEIKFKCVSVIIKKSLIAVKKIIYVGTQNRGYFCVHDLSLPLTPDQREGGSLIGIFQLCIKNDNVLYDILFCIFHELKISTRRSPLPAGRG